MTEIVNEVRLGASKMFDHLKISCADFLDQLTGRSICPKCGRSRKYFCYTCYVAMDEIADRIPNIQLPLKVDIIKHPREVDGKSTAVHAAVLAPNDVSIYTYPYIPTYDPKDKVLMIFPGKSSTSLAQLLKKLNTDTTRFGSTSCNGVKINAVPSQKYPFHIEVEKDDCHQELCATDLCHSSPMDFSEMATKETFMSLFSSVMCNGASSLDSLKEAKKLELCHGAIKGGFTMNRRLLRSRFPFERVILIDSTWNQVRGIRKDERLKGILRVELTERESCFWRFQRGKPRTYLATIEAIYYFMVDLHKTFISEEYDGEYDDLLFFFKYMFFKIHSLYDPSKLRVYQQVVKN